MALDFPASPTHGQQYTLNGISYTYDVTSSSWLTTYVTPDFGIMANVANVYIVTNSAFGVANAAFGVSNTAYGAANAAFSSSNTKASTGKAIAMAMVFGG